MHPIGQTDLGSGAELLFLDELGGARPGFAVTSQARDDGPTVSVRGELDRASTAAVRREAERQIARDGSRLVLDLSAATFIDSAGLHLIGDLDERLARHAGQLVLVVSPGPVERVLGLVAPPESVEVIHRAHSRVRLPACEPSPGLEEHSLADLSTTEPLDPHAIVTEHGDLRQPGERHPLGGQHDRPVLRSDPRRA